MELQQQGTRVPRPRGSAVAAMIMATMALACERSPIAPDPSVGAIDKDIIGGFAANDPALDAIGSLVIHIPGGPFRPPFSQELCGATLVGPESVLTAKHCA